jgi:hypothetical protein
MASCSKLSDVLQRDTKLDGALRLQAGAEMSTAAFNGVQRFVSIEVDLSMVDKQDKTLVQGVCAVLASMIKDLPTPSVTVKQTGAFYIVTASYPKGTVVEVTQDDLHLVSEVNSLRVSCVSVLADGSQTHVKARVSSMEHPITVTDVALVQVTKKRKWFSSD